MNEKRLRAEFRRRQQDIALAIAAIVAMVALNIWLLPGVAIVALAPIGWLLASRWRWHAIRSYFSRTQGRA